MGVGTVDGDEQLFVSAAPPMYQIRVADVNHDGRADLVVFHYYPVDQQQVNYRTWPAGPPSGITLILLSNGDGTFTSTQGVGRSRDVDERGLDDVECGGF